MLEVAEVEIFHPLYNFAKALYGFGASAFEVFSMSLGKIAETFGISGLPSAFYDVSLIQFTFGSLGFVVGWIVVSWLIDVLP